MSALLIRIAIRYLGTRRFLNQFQIGLKEVDLVFWVQSDNCLLPVFRAHLGPHQGRHLLERPRELLRKGDAPRRLQVVPRSL